MTPASRFANLLRNETLLLPVVATLVMAVYAAVVLSHFHEAYAPASGSPSPGLMLGYGANEVNWFLASLNSQQLVAYAAFIRIWDVLFALLCTLVSLGWIHFFYRSKPWLLLLPLLQMLADWAENYGEFLLLKQYLQLGGIEQNTVFWSSNITLLKWGLAALCYGLIGWGVASKVWRRFKPLRS